MTADCQLDLVLIDSTGRQSVSVTISQLVIAGWTGRDQLAIEHHIKELEALGIARPRTTPIYYRASATRLTTAPAIEAVGPHSSGEVEYVLLRHQGRTWVGIGSDHTDREVEKYGVTVSKQMCDKPVAPEFWLVDDVAGHWDQLTSRAWIIENGAEILYQQGPLAAMLPPERLITGYFGDTMREGAAMFCGTHGAIGGIRPSARFRFELADPVLGRTIGAQYEIAELPIEG
ncbi:MAG: DUF2848 domain-containing protein [Sphingomonadaceae bacterium]|nr:DUF2848 domain-containing protein [Sphingomonadaceae bacterium]